MPIMMTDVSNVTREIHIIINIDAKTNQAEEATTLHPPVINLVHALFYAAFPAPGLLWQSGVVQAVWLY
jgi:hypothetical protein